MPLLYLPDLRLHAEISGPDGAPAIVLLHGLGLSGAIWDDLAHLLPEARVLRLDLRGHGESDAPVPPYAMGALIRDVEGAMAHFGLKDAVVLGHGLGGLIAQGLAVKRLDLVRALILSNTAAKLGHAAHWARDIAAVEAQGLAGVAVDTFERWLGRGWHKAPLLDTCRDIFLKTSPQGWMGAAAAASGTDFYETTAQLRLPALTIACAKDAMTPADLVRETGALIPGGQFTLLQGAGHLPMLEIPDAYHATIRAFLSAIGHFTPSAG